MATNKATKPLPSRIHLDEFLASTKMSDMHKSAFATCVGGKLWMSRDNWEIQLKEFQSKRK